METADDREGQIEHTSRGSGPSPTHHLQTMDYAIERSPTYDSSLMPLEK